MKKLIYFFLNFIIMFAFTACDGLEHTTDSSSELSSSKTDKYTVSSNCEVNTPSSPIEEYKPCTLIEEKDDVNIYEVNDYFYHTNDFYSIVDKDSNSTFCYQITVPSQYYFDASILYDKTNPNELDVTNHIKVGELGSCLKATADTPFPNDWYEKVNEEFINEFTILKKQSYVNKNNYTVYLCKTVSFPSSSSTEWYEYQYRVLLENNICIGFSLYTNKKDNKNIETQFKNIIDSIKRID